MSNKLFYILGLLFITFIGNSQSTSPTLLASASDVGFKNDVQLKWSLGEISIVPIFHSTSILTQGFNQPNLRKKNLSQIVEKDNLEINIYPNPASNHLMINLQKKLSPKIKISIFDNIGHAFICSYFQANDKQFSVNIENLQAGLYFLQLITESQESYNTCFFKIN